MAPSLLSQMRARLMSASPWWLSQSEQANMSAGLAKRLVVLNVWYIEMLSGSNARRTERPLDRTAL